MADRKISELTQITGADVDDANDEIAIVDTSASETKAITREELFKDIDGDITLSGTVDGRDVAADGSKLDAIDQGLATTDSPEFAGLTVDTVDINGDLTVDTDTLFVDASTNRVGIGTSSPERALHIQRGSGAGAVLSASSYLAILDSDVDSVFQFRTPNTQSAWIRFSDPESFGAGAIEYDHSIDAMRFDVNASEAMRIDSSGRVGIGTSSPGSKLSVVGLPTSSAGLSAGDIYIDAGTLKIVT